MLQNILTAVHETSFQVSLFLFVKTRTVLILVALSLVSRIFTRRNVDNAKIEKIISEWFFFFSLSIERNDEQHASNEYAFYRLSSYSRRFASRIFNKATNVAIF